MKDKWINKRIILIFAACISIYVLVYSVNSNISKNNIKNIIISEVGSDIIIQKHLVHGDLDYYLYRVLDRPYYIGVSCFNKNWIGSYVRYESYITNEINKFTYSEEYGNDLPIKYVIFGHNIDKKITSIEISLINSGKLINVNIPNDEYYIKIIELKENSYPKTITYYNKNHNIINVLNF